MEIEFACCFCGEPVKGDHPTALIFDAPGLEEFPWQQWWVHEKCLRDRLLPEANVGKEEG